MKERRKNIKKIIFFTISFTLVLILGACHSVHHDYSGSINELRANRITRPRLEHFQGTWRNQGQGDGWSWNRSCEFIDNTFFHINEEINPYGARQYQELGGTFTFDNTHITFYNAQGNIIVRQRFEISHDMFFLYEHENWVSGMFVR